MAAYSHFGSVGLFKIVEKSTLGTNLSIILVLTVITLFSVATYAQPIDSEDVSFATSTETLQPLTAKTSSTKNVTLQLASIYPESLKAALSKSNLIPSLIKSYSVTGKQHSTELNINFNELTRIKLFEHNDEDKMAHRTVLNMYPNENHSKGIIKTRVGIWPDRARIVIEADKELNAELLSGQTGQAFTLYLQNINTAKLKSSFAKLVKGANSSPFTQISVNDQIFPDNQKSEAQFKLNKTVRLSTFKLKPEGKYNHRFVLDFFFDSETTARKVKSPTPEKKQHQVSAMAVKAVAKQQRITTEIWLDVRLNRQEPTETVLALKDVSDVLWLPRDVLNRWGVTIVPAISPQTHAGNQYYSVSALGMRSTINMSRLSAEITAPAETLKPTKLLASDNHLMSLTPSPLGGFLNYDITTTHSELQAKTISAGLFEVGAFNGWGSGTTTSLVNQSHENDRYNLIRLNTTWRKDDPSNMRSLVVGDSITKSTSWSGAARFGGVQWGSNFSIRPDYITSPLLSVSDQAALPSTVDVYVNNALRFKGDVPSGPFSIDDIPAVTGVGETKVVIRDILGRERILTQSFYSNSLLLREGLSEYSVEAGLLRESFSRKSNAYGAPVAAATWRKGISNAFTLESHAHALKSNEHGIELMAGIGSALTTPYGAVVTTAIAGSESEYGTGSLGRIGLQKQGRPINLGLTSDYATKNYHQFGSSFNSLRPRNRTNAYISSALGSYGNVSIGYTKQTYWNHQQISFGTANYSLGLGRFGQFTLSAIHFTDDDNTIIQAMLTIPLSTGLTASASGSKSQSDMQKTVHLQKNLPVGEGVGYRLTAHSGMSEQYKASISYQNDKGLLTAEATQQEGTHSYRGSATGGIAILGNKIHRSQRIDNSFGVVRLDGFANTRIYAENQVVAKTDKNGNALVPRLRAYELNTIRIEQSDLPLNTHISDIELEVSPYYRSGVFIDFPVETRQSALFSVVDQHGSSLPLGSAIRTASGKLFPVGYRGEVFISPVEESKIITGISGDQECQFELNLSDENKAMIDLGVIICPLH